MRLSMDTLIRNGTIVTAIDTFQADIGITGGTIVQIGRDLRGEADTRVIDASGRYLLSATKIYGRHQAAIWSTCTSGDVVADAVPYKR